MKYFYLFLLLVVLAVIISLIRKFWLPTNNNFFVELLISGLTIVILVFVFRAFWRK